MAAKANIVNLGAGQKCFALQNSGTIKVSDVSYSERDRGMTRLCAERKYAAVLTHGGQSRSNFFVGIETLPMKKARSNRYHDAKVGRGGGAMARILIVAATIMVSLTAAQAQTPQIANWAGPYVWLTAGARWGNSSASNIAVGSGYYVPGNRVAAVDELSDVCFRWMSGD